eukprot:CAMPEP_0178400228 /NCGR_PEP_ID=MMETSP0689_2-20121128/15683_1 /TAXON_ID=160604 /ORGANISM="Amphidinium massartii, Strain CS-259" /LENGTH=583 /DNA_ID=CAMNT_0020021021 /DNA_START=76 /DNA_END=1824 /DNA_ORIENTATION=-
MLWSEKHQPTSEAALVISKKRVQEVKDFLTSASRPVLVLQGPPGSGKAATVKGLCSDLRLEVVEWSPPRGNPKTKLPGISEPLGEAFLRFLAQSDRYTGLSQEGLRRKRVSLVREFPSTLMMGSGGGGYGGDFADKFTQLVNDGAVRRAVLTFNDGTWEDRRLTQRLFNNVQPSLVTTLRFDDVARTFVQKALDNIIKAQGFAPAAQHCAAIAAECGGDLRHAVNALQLAFGGLRPVPAEALAPAPKSRQRGSKANGKAAAKAKANAAASNGATQGGSEQAPANPDSLGLRPASLNFFHSLGRLLYNKRMPPGAQLPLAATQLADGDSGAMAVDGSPQQAAKRRRKDVSAEPKQLPSALMRPKSRRPPLYFDPDDVLESASADPSQVVDWLFTNAPRFYGDVSDLAEFSEAVARADAWSQSRYVFREDVAGAAWGSLDAVVQTRACLDSNLCPGPPIPYPSAESTSSGFGSGFNMQKPEMLTVIRARQRHMDGVNNALGRMGHAKLGCVSAGQSALLHTFPFVHLMLTFSGGKHKTLASLPHQLMKQVMELSTFNGRLSASDADSSQSVGNGSYLEQAQERDW